MRFDPTPGGVRAARQFVCSAVTQQVDAELVDELLLALSEMATNAVLHAGTAFEVVIETDGVVRLEVEDGSSVVPVRRSPSPQVPGGRGLQIIEEVCDRWGVHVAQGRKCVWCERDVG
jgi:anti-sigma regulatory factor (Ser/Thr protein kinase)